MIKGGGFKGTGGLAPSPWFFPDEIVKSSGSKELGAQIGVEPNKSLSKKEGIEVPSRIQGGG